VLTEPRSLFKSSTKDSSLSTFEIVLQRDPPPRLQDDGRRAAYDAGPEGLSVYGSHRKRWISSLFSMDPDLEAFSHMPTDGSFGALAVQLTPYTNCLNQRFLSY